MKKLLMAATILAVAAFVMMGCSLLFGKTYAYSFGTLFCYEITTNDLELQTELESEGFIEGSCSTTNSVGSCSITYEADLTSATATVYYYDEYYTAETAQTACENSDGTWSAQ